MTAYTYTTIDAPEVIQIVPYSIDATGQIVGYYLDASNNPHSFLDGGRVFSTIDPPGSTQAYAYGINDSGKIVGYYHDGSGHAYGFLDTGVPSQLLIRRAALPSSRGASTPQGKSSADILTAAPSTVSYIAPVSI